MTSTASPPWHWSIDSSVAITATSTTTSPTATKKVTGCRNAVSTMPPKPVCASSSSWTVASRPSKKSPMPRSVASISSFATTTFPTRSCPRLWLFSTPSAATITTPTRTSRAAAWVSSSCRPLPPTMALSSTACTSCSTSVPCRLHRTSCPSRAKIASSPTTGCGASTPTPPSVCKPSLRCADWPTAN